MVSVDPCAGLDERDAKNDNLLGQIDSAGDDERVLKVTVTKIDGRIGWTRDCDTMMVDAVEKGGAAERAGIKPKMRIIVCNGQMVSSDEEFTQVMATIPDDEPTFTLVLDLEEQLEDQATVALDPAVIAQARATTLREQVESDAELMRGIELFMTNHYSDAESLFAKRAAVDPLASLAHATIAFLRAGMSFAQRDMKEARRRITRTLSIANQIAPPKSATASLKSLVYKAKPPTNAELRCRVIATEAQLLRSILLLTEDSVLSHMRAGIGLRRGYVDIESLSKQVDGALAKATLPAGHPEGLPEGMAAPEAGEGLGEWGKSAYHLYDYNTIGGLQFGLGAINCALSCVPEKVLALLSLFGYMCNRELGFKNLNTALEGGGTRSAVAGLFLTMFHGVLPSFSSVLAKVSIPKAVSLVDTMLGQYPTSAIYLWVAGRVSRLQRHTQEAIAHFNKAIELGRKEEFPQLTHAAFYELAWCHCFELDWEPAIPCFKLLYEESEWSKSFNAYAVAVCYAELGKSAEAKEWYQASQRHLGRKFGGRTISVEQFVERRVTFLEKESGGTFEGAQMPGIEFIMLFNAFSQMGEAQISAVCNMVQGRLEEIKAGSVRVLHEEHVLVLDLIVANANKELGRPDEARKHYKYLSEQYPPKKWKKLLQHETWVVPYAAFEHACLAYSEGDVASTTELLSLADSFKDYNFEIPLALRVHLTKDLLRDEKTKQAPAKKKSRWNPFA